MSRRIAVFLVLLVAVAGACNDDNGDGQGSSGEVPVRDLRPGDCFDGGPVPQDAGEEERSVLVVAAVPCGKSHEKEVFGVFEHPAPPDALFPGEEEVAKVAQDGCAERFPGYVGHPYKDSELQVAVIAPGPVFWDEDDRAIVCTLFHAEKPLKGSQKADGD